MTLSRARLGFLVSALFALCSRAPYAQTSVATTTQPEFEVASVRMSPPDAGYTYISTTYPMNRFTASNASFSILLSIAFDVDSNKITGGPDWIGSQLYDIGAKVEGDAALTREQMQPLLQDLLEQRFHLAVHREKKDVSGYALIVAKNGAQLQANKGAPYLAYRYADRILVQNASVQSFAAMLSLPTGRPVIDKTGIQGLYDFDLHYAATNDPGSNLPDLFTAVQEQLGLKFESQKVPVETLVVDHVDKVPIAN